MFICLSTRTVLKCFDNEVFNRILQKPKKNPDLSLYIISETGSCTNTFLFRERGNSGKTVIFWWIRNVYLNKFRLVWMAANE